MKSRLKLALTVLVLLLAVAAFSRFLGWMNLPSDSVALEWSDCSPPATGCGPLPDSGYLAAAATQTHQPQLTSGPQSPN